MSYDMETILIFDSSSNTRNQYIDALGDDYNLDTLGDAMGFESEEAARAFIEKKGYGDWAVVTTVGVGLADAPQHLTAKEMCERLNASCKQHGGESFMCNKDDADSREWFLYAWEIPYEDDVQIHTTKEGYAVRAFGTIETFGLDEVDNLVKYISDAWDERGDLID